MASSCPLALLCCPLRDSENTSLCHYFWRKLADCMIFALTDLTSIFCRLTVLLGVYSCCTLQHRLSLYYSHSHEAHDFARYFCYSLLHLFLSLYIPHHSVTYLMTPAATSHDHRPVTIKLQLGLYVPYSLCGRKQVLVTEELESHRSQMHVILFCFNIQSESCIKMQMLKYFICFSVSTFSLTIV